MASTFYSQISANKRNSILLGGLLVVVLGGLGSAIGYALTGSLGGAIAATTLAIGVGLLASLVSFFSGDRIVLAASSAKPVSEQEQPQLYNIVRELTLAGSLPMPQVYLIDDSSMNAFATGRDPEHASIAVTTGLLSRMDREEVQGVIAHELSHVRNYDIRFSLLVGVMVGSIALLADFFLRFTFWGGRGSRSDDSRNGGALQAIVMVAALVLAILAPIAARLVQLAVSRQREYLADASGVELTRNPVGLERALATIAGDTEVLEAANRATQHLYFTNPIMKLGDGQQPSALFSTHPPLVDRINRLRVLRGAPAVGSPEEELATLP